MKSNLSRYLPLFGRDFEIHPNNCVLITLWCRILFSSALSNKGIFSVKISADLIKSKNDSNLNIGSEWTTTAQNFLMTLKKGVIIEDEHFSNDH